MFHIILRLNSAAPQSCQSARSYMIVLFKNRTAAGSRQRAGSAGLLGADGEDARGSGALPRAAQRRTRDRLRPGYAEGNIRRAAGECHDRENERLASPEIPFR